MNKRIFAQNFDKSHKMNFSKHINYLRHTVKIFSKPGGGGECF